MARRCQLGVFAPPLPIVRSNSRHRLKSLFEEEGYETFDLFQTHDWTLRYQLVVWMYEICQLMVQGRTAKKIVQIVNIYSQQHNDYVRAVLDNDCRKIAEVHGIRFIITTRAGAEYNGNAQPDSILFIHLAKHNRVVDSERRYDVVNDILNRSHNMYI